MEAALAEHLEGHTPTFTVEYRVRHRNGTWRWIMDRGQAVLDGRGRPARIAGSQTDVTDRKQIELLLEQQARTDALTGLVNRREFDRRFAGIVAGAQESGKPLVSCICDLDRFKEVNDSFGHSAGDHVLAQFGEILRTNLRRTDLVARIGGDEFLMALPNTTGEDARAIVERIREQLHAVNFRSNGKVFRVSSSFGIAELREKHVEGADLLAEADRMLYSAKNSGRNKTISAVA